MRNCSSGYCIYERLINLVINFFLGNNLKQMRLSTEEDGGQLVKPHPKNCGASLSVQDSTCISSAEGFEEDRKRTEWINTHSSLVQ